MRVIEGIPHSVVHQSWPLVLKKIDLSALQSAEREREVSRLLIDDPRVRYRLEEEPGVRATLLRLGAEDHVFILMLHHIIGDWASEGVIWRELSALYRAELTGKPPELPPLPIQDGDYAAWQSDEFKHNDFEPDLAFWEENLRGAPQLLELPSDRQRPAALTYRGKRQRFVLNASLTAKLRDLSAASEVTLFTVCAAALSTLLYRYTGQEDIPLGIPINDRERAEFQQLIGFLLHTQVLRTPLEPGMTFRALMARVQKAAIDMYLHRAAPFDQVVRRLRPERNRSYSPLFQVMLNWRDRDQMLSFIGLDRMTVESLLAESRTSKFDLTLFATDCGEEIWLEAEYSTDLFDDDRIARMLRHFETLLESVASDPGQRLSEYQFLPPEERQLILEQWNQTALAFQQDRRLHELFEEQVRRTPDALAACFGDLQWTYRELDQRANQLAGYLQSVGAGPNVLVAVAMERSLQLLAGILAILKTGGAYLPLDPNYPKARLNLILDDANAAVVLAEEAQRPLLAECKRRVVFLDTDQPAIRSASPLTPARGSADDLAYVIYTSGSTGVPKGVAATHRSTLNRLEWMWARYPFSKDDVCCAKTSINFVDSVSEIFTPLLRGVPLVLISAGNVQDVPALVEILDRRRITRIVLVPALLRELLATLESTGAARKSSLRMVVTSGEALTRDLARAFFDVMPPDTLLLNLYGSSEVAGDVTAFEVNRNCDRERIPIGRPIANTQIYILDRHLNPVPIGVAGELLAGGLNLAREYL
ncbi:MAG TPA: AMP-binding protein, partial [Bryobacteraceae bacterium]|nr:AMP-binding protein [Bryobacteraceae bacterium]